MAFAGRGVGSNSIQCTSCKKWVHRKCSGNKGSMYKVMKSFICRGCVNPVTGTGRTRQIPQSRKTAVCVCVCVLLVMFKEEAARKNTHTHTIVLQLAGFCPGQPGWAGIRRNIHSLTPIIVINHPLSASSTYYDPWHLPCSIDMPDSLFPQTLSKFSLVYLLTWHPPLHTPAGSS